MASIKRQQQFAGHCQHGLGAAVLHLRRIGFGVVATIRPQQPLHARRQAGIQEVVANLRFLGSERLTSILRRRFKGIFAGCRYPLSRPAINKGHHSFVSLAGTALQLLPQLPVGPCPRCYAALLRGAQRGTLGV